MGGIQVNDLKGVTIQIDGELIYSNDMKAWPRKGPEKDADVLACMTFTNVRTNFILIPHNIDRFFHSTRDDQSLT